MNTVFTLRIPTAELININDERSWSHFKRAARVSKLRDRGCMTGRALGRKFDCPVRVVMTFTWPEKRRRDVGNWYPTAKALVDGLVDAGVVADDNSARVVGPDLRESFDPTPTDKALKVCRVFVEVNPLDV